MAKEPAPAFQFYPSDWIHDLDEHPLEIEGAWIRICCKLFFSETCGSAEKSLENWARILRISPKKSLTLIQYLDNQKIADVDIQNDSIRITSRRMVKDAHIREIRRLAGSRGGNPDLLKKKSLQVLDNQTSPNLDNQTGNQKPTPSSSSSSSIKETKQRKARKPIDVVIPEWLSPDLWQGFLDHRKTLRKPMTDYAQTLMFKKLGWLKDQGHNPDHLLKDAMVKGWQDVYPKEVS